MSPERRQLKESSEEDEEEESEEADRGDEEAPKVTAVAVSERSSQSNGTLRSVNVFASAEELEKARRLEERERIDPSTITLAHDYNPIHTFIIYSIKLQFKKV